MLDAAVATRWHQIVADATGDEVWYEGFIRLCERRKAIRLEILTLIRAFSAGDIDVETLRAEFDTRTRTEWSGFGFKGMSFAMFLNKLMKYLGEEPELAPQLRATLDVPRSVLDAQAVLSHFVGWIESFIQRGVITRKSIQPARASTFVSAFWHLQAPEVWPVFYETARTALEREGVYTPLADPVESYFAFVAAFTELQNELGVTSWMLEQVCRRHTLGGAHSEEIQRSAAPAVMDASEETPVEESRHTRTQWTLATLGNKLGCRVWIAANDRSKRCNGETLGSLSVDALPSLGLDDDSIRLIKLIDVLWLRSSGKQVVAAFEIEHTTSIYSGLLRMSDLVAQSPNLNFPLYVVSPRERLNAVEEQLRRPTFQILGLHSRCGFFSEEELLEHAEEIAKWAGDPRAINKLARYVADE